MPQSSLRKFNWSHHHFSLLMDVCQMHNVSAPQTANFANGPAIWAYQSPQCETDICWNFILHASPCFTHTVLKCW